MVPGGFGLAWGLFYPHNNDDAAIGKNKNQKRQEILQGEDSDAEKQVNIFFLPFFNAIFRG